MKKIVLRLVICVLASALMTGCAHKPNPADPYEGYNHVMYKFNMGLDKVVLRPIAVVYSKVVPSFLQTGVTNFFANLDEVSTLPNDILQGKLQWAMIDIWRFFINSTIGIGGLFDVATAIGMPKHHENFGMTLAYWTHEKDRHPTYLILPFLGPSTFRDAFGRVADLALDPLTYIKPRWLSYARRGGVAVSHRAQLLPADQLLQQAFNPYVFMRNAYMQNRRELLARNEALKVPGLPTASPENFGKYNTLAPATVTPDEHIPRNGIHYKNPVDNYNATTTEKIYREKPPKSPGD